MLDTVGRVALVAVLGVLALPLLGGMRDTGGALQPGCQLPGGTERFVHLVAGASSIDVRAQVSGDGCFAASPTAGTDYETPGGLAVEISGGLVGTLDSAGQFEAATWRTPDGVVSTLGSKLVLPFWSVGAGVVLVLLAAGAIILYGGDH